MGNIQRWNRRGRGGHLRRGRWDADGVQCGTLVCDLGAINGTELPNEVTCNGKDDDCDGSVDEGLLTSPPSVTPWFAVSQPPYGWCAGDGSQIYSYGGVLTGAQNKTVGELWSLDLSLVVDASNHTRAGALTCIAHIR